ncbi:pectinesterase family protein [Pseudolysinimonas sp.]|uniref:pectinesterase family protein n=1 Tax=Pseudolysinimonas sp. TaxID=2680009 RepID=UPI003F7CD915
MPASPASPSPTSPARARRRSGLLIGAAVTVLALVGVVVPLQGALAAPDTTPPSSPSSLSASYYGGVGTVLTWGRVSAGDLATYRVYRSSTPAVTTSSTLVTSTTSLKATDATATGGASYSYAVVAVDTSGNVSKLSSVKTIVAKDTTKPSTPSSLRATAAGDGITLDWADNDQPDLRGYSVSRSGSSSGSYALLTPSPITASRFTDAQAPAGVKSYYRVTAIDLSGNVSSSASASATRPAGAPVAPAAPSGFVAKLGSAGVPTLSWSASSGATGYVLSRSASAAGPFTRINAGSTTATSFTDSGAPVGATAYYTLTATNAAGSSSAVSASVAVPRDSTPPKAPSSPKVAVIPTGGVTVSWKANAEADLAGYLVMKRNGDDVYVPWTPTGSASTLVTPSFSDLSVVEGDTDYYRVRAVDTSGNQSSYLSVTAKNPMVAPGAPTSLKVTQDPTAGLDLAWTAPKDLDLAGYSISRSTSSSGVYALLKTIPVADAGASLRFVDTSAPKGVTVYYRVTAQDAVGNISKPSSTVSGTSLTTPIPIPVEQTVITVGPGGDVPTVTQALAAIPAGSLAAYRIDIAPGTYSEAFEVSRSNVTLHGTGATPGDVVISAARASGSSDPDEPEATLGTAGSAVVSVTGSNVTLDNLTVANTFDEAGNPQITNAQAVALRVEGDRFVADTVRLLGNQDTLLADTPKPTTRIRQYYVDSYIEGDVDYLFGAGTAVFQRDTFRSLDRGKSNNGYLTAASTDKGSKYGFLITDSKIVSDAAPGTINLGRPWHPSADPDALASVVIMNTWLPAAIDTAAPWDDMASTNSSGVKVNFSWQDARFDEYANIGPGATINANRPQLTASQAANATPEKYLAGKDGWNPVTAPSTTVPATPTNLVAAPDTRVVHLTWSDDTTASVTGWSVYRADATGPFTKIASTVVPSYSDSTVTDGATYRYVVTADSRSGVSSAQSAEVSVLVAAAPLVTDFSVDPNGPSDATHFTTLAAALAAAPAGTATDPTVISLAAGRYAEYDTIAKPYTIVVGATGTASDVVITGNRAAGTPTGTVTDGIPDTYGTSGSATLVITGNNVQLRNLTVENAYVEGTYANGQAVALRTTGDRLRYENVRLLGNQDTWYANSPSTTTPARSYFHGGYVEGDVDFIFGRGTVVIDDSTLKALDHGTSPNGAVTAASTDVSQKYGILITDSRIIGTAPDGSQNLGRPWQPGKTQADGSSVPDTNAVAQVVVRDTWLGPVVSGTQTWTNMINSGVTTTWQSARFAEYDNIGPGAGTSATRPQLTDDQAATYTSTAYLAGSDGWNPVVDTAPSTAPAAVTGLTATPDHQQIGLSWNDSVDPQVVGYRVYRSTGSDPVAADAAHLVAEVAKPSYLDKGLVDGTAYDYLVVAVTRDGTISPTVGVSATPAVTPLVADLTVAADGSGDVTTLQAALAAIPAGTPARPKVILVKPGVYRGVVSSSKANIIIAGTTGDPRDVVLTFDNANGTAASASTCPAVTATTCGTAGSATVTLGGAGVQVRDLTIQNSFDSASHPEIGNFNTQAVALRATGDRQVYQDVRLLGVQDTLNADASGGISADGSGYPRQYYVDSFIEGNVDFVFGRATAVFDRTTFHATAHTGGTIFAPSTASKAKGYLVVDSRIASDNDGAFALGRPWRAWNDGAYADNSRGETTIKNTWIAAGITTSQPWIDFAPNAWTDGRFAEYGDTGPGATVNANRPQLNADQASSRTAAAYLQGGDGWNPVADPTPQTAPTSPYGLSAAAGSGQAVLSWQENAEADVVGYRVYRDGSLVATTSGAGYTATGLLNGRSYGFQVSALDAAGDESPLSATVSVTPAMRIDATVQAGGAYPTLQAAVDAAPGTAPWVVQVAPGTYSGTTTITRSNVTVVGGGAGAGDVTLTNATATPTMTITGSNVSVSGIGIQNTSGVSNGPAVSMTGDKILLSGVALSATDRAVWADVPTAGATSRQLIEASTITGATNIVLGRATLVIHASTIIPTRTSGTVLIPSTTATGGNGILVIGSSIAPAPGVSDVRLGAPYAQGPTSASNAPQAIIRDTAMAAGIKSSPWQDFNGYAWLNARFAEYANTGAGATVTATRPQLSPADSVGVTVANWIGAPSWYPAIADPATPADVTPTGPVTGLTATTGDATATLSWTAPTDADLAGYAIYRAAGSGVTPSPATLVARVGLVSSFVDAGLVNGSTYTWAVVALDAVGNRAGATTVTATPADTTPPAAPTGLSGVAADGKAILSWTANAESDLAGYNVYRDGTKITSAPLAAASFTDTGLVNGTSYAYRVTAVDTAGNESAPSSSAAVVPAPGDNVPPAVPTGVSTVLGRNAVTVHWTAVGDADLAGYDVYRASGSSTAALIGSVGAAGTSFTDPTVAIGTTYSYTVVSKDGSGNASAPSAAAAATPLKVDIVVAADGSGDATTLQAVLGQVDGTGALVAANPGSLANNADYSSQGYRTILVKPGTYTGPVVSGNRYGVNIVGATGNPADVVITAPGGTVPTMSVSGNQWTFRSLTLQSVAASAGAQATAVQVKAGDKQVFDNVRLLGDKQTVLASTANSTTFSRIYITNSFIEGGADLIVGRAVTVVDRSTIHVLDRPGASLTDSSIAAGSPYGFLITNSSIVTDGAANTIYLGRPYSTQGQAQVVVRNTALGAAIVVAKPWNDWDAVTTWTAGRFSEYQNSGPGAAIVDPTTRPQLSDAAAGGFTAASYLAGADGWNPTGR